LFSFDFFLNPPSLASTMLHRVPQGPQGPQGHVVSSAVGVSGHDRFGSEADYGEVDGSDDGDVGDASADSVGEAAANGDEESEGEGAVEGGYASAHDDAPGDDAPVRVRVADIEAEQGHGDGWWPGGGGGQGRSLKVCAA
jgi:hypothetical protein